MKVRVYGFYDRKSESYIGDSAGLVLFRHDAVAMRSFGDLCRQEGSIFAKHPDDYELHGLAQFDTETGELLPAISPVTALVQPIVLATARQVLDT